MKIIITGANFNNKGAQAMLMVAMSELMKQYPQVSFYYSARDRKGYSNIYNFGYVYRWAFINALGMKCGKLNNFCLINKFVISNLKAFLLKNYSYMFMEHKYVKQIDDIAGIIDISGFALSSKFGQSVNNSLLDLIDYASGCNIPIILLPQSFGPFDYEDSNMKNRIKETLKKATLIFAREKDGYNLLKKMGLENIYLSEDLVLQNRGIEWSVIAKKIDDNQKIDTLLEREENCVAIIPNKNLIYYLNSEKKIYDFYRKLVEYLLQKKKKIYLLWNSTEDYKICKKIKRLFRTEKNVLLVQKELNCFEYEKMVKKFDYIIASRFHAIVMAYRKGVPCIGIGWAEKYRNLFKVCGQEKYIFDAVDMKEERIIFNGIESLDEHYREESINIGKKLKELQKNNCFEKVFQNVDKWLGLNEQIY